MPQLRLLIKRSFKKLDNNKPERRDNILNSLRFFSADSACSAVKRLFYGFISLDKTNLTSIDRLSVIMVQETKPRVRNAEWESKISVMMNIMPQVRAVSYL